jgi:glucosamine--fructose-6-phosphate aminotransferase (isomerizing)
VTTITDLWQATSLMAADMAEQPAVLARLLGRRRTLVADIGEVMPPSLRGVALVGRGSSGHAAAFGRYLLETASGLPAAVVPPTLLSAHRSGSPYTGFLAFGISQSGESPDVANALAVLRRAGARTVALTAHPSSRMGRDAHLALDLATGAELAVPATKTFTATLFLLLLAAEALGPVTWSVQELERLPGALLHILADSEPAERAAVGLEGHDGWACVGSGLLAPIAAEAALKLEEVALVVADHHSSASFRHGPIATAGPRRAVLAFAAGPDDSTLGLVDDLRRRGSPVLLASPGPDADLVLPALPGPLLALAAAVRAQQLALALAERRHLDPDHPPGLTKVTRT